MERDRVSWLAILALAVGTYAMKAAGPVLVGKRTFPAGVQRLFVLLAVALLAAVIALATVADGDRLTADAPLMAGMAAAGIAVWRKAPFVVVVLLAAAVAAALRLIS
jgi:branched-subunit amino acid transport protein